MRNVPVDAARRRGALEARALARQAGVSDRVEFRQQDLFDSFRRVYNEERPHSALGYQSPAGFRQKQLLVA